MNFKTFCTSSYYLSVALGIKFQRVHFFSLQGRALFSRTDRRTVATLKECWSEDTVGDFQRSTQVCPTFSSVYMCIFATVVRSYFK